MLETSKSFAKEFMVSNAIPTADFGIFEASQEAIDFAHRFDGRVAVKVDGLAGGKGVFVCGSIEEAETAIKNILNERAFGEAGRKIVVEERLVGRECTVMTICNGRRAFFFGTARDHKRAFDNDQGPNTGGMGAFSEANTIDERAISRITQEIAGPCVSRLGFRGFLYLGLMITDEGPKVLEFNARLGDPEAQAILPRLETDLMTTMLMMKDSDVNPELKWSKDQCCAVVMCSEGYPGSPKTGDLITGLNDAGRIEKTLVFHSGTRRSGGSFFTAGGRVLTVTGQGGTIDLASQRAYSAIESISWPGEHHRKDIGRLS
jgi:phosphoribosylamine--glycine ligase